QCWFNLLSRSLSTYISRSISSPSARSPSSFLYPPCTHFGLHSFPTRRSSDLWLTARFRSWIFFFNLPVWIQYRMVPSLTLSRQRSEDHTSELQSRFDLVCRLLLEKKKSEVSVTDGRAEATEYRGHHCVYLALR